jgi:hypothetical protein
MSEQDWSKQGIFDTPLVRCVAQEQMQIEQPIAVDIAAAPAPPVPDEQRAAVFAALANPPLANIQDQLSTVETSPEQPADRAATVAQLGMALYLLQTLHWQDQPGAEHASRRESPDEEDDETAP